MELLKKRKLIWLAVSLGALALGIAGGALGAVFALKLKYFPLVLFFLLFCHGCIGAPIYFHLYFIADRRLKLTLCVLDGESSVTGLAEKLGLLSEAAQSELDTVIKRGYLTGYEASEGVIKRITD